MKIILAQPSFKEVYQEIGEPVQEPPLGLLYIATCLKEDGHEVQLYDLIFPDHYEKFLASSSSADYAGVTVTTPLYPMALELCSKLKKSNSKIKIVLGGPHISATPYGVLKEAVVDYVVVGEGEEAMRHLLQGDLNYSGIGYRQNGESVLNPPQLIENLDSISFPDRSLLDIEKYRLNIPGGNSGRYQSLITSRGCPFKCCFCDSHITFGRRTRFRSPENVIAEIKECVNNYNVNHFALLDDTATLNQKRFEKICDLILQERLHISYHCATRVDSINENLLRKMKQTGCYRIHIGCESGDDEILRGIGKGITTQQIVNCFKLCKKVGISTYAYFVLGLPHETEETVRTTIDFSIRLNPDFIQYTIAMPFPGTALYKYVLENGLLLKDIDYSSFKWYGHPVFYENIKPRDLMNLQKEAYSRFYRRPSFIAKQLLSLRTPNDVKKLVSGFDSFRRLTKKVGSAD